MKVNISRLFMSILAIISSNTSANEFTGQEQRILNEYNSSADSEPLDSREQSIGFYSEGSLRNPASVENLEEGIVRIFPNRDRKFASDDLVSLLRNAGIAMKQKFPQGERLQIGDLSAKRGGKISGHASHQNGLDADMSYFRSNFTEQSQTLDRFDEHFVLKDQVTRNFDLERNWSLMKYFVNNGNVGRIFVGKKVKKALCRYSSKIKDQERAKVLRRLRPWPNHDTHLHLRLKCPENSPRCDKQREPPSGDRCSDTN